MPHVPLLPSEERHSSTLDSHLNLQNLLIRLHALIHFAHARHLPQETQKEQGYIQYAKIRLPTFCITYPYINLPMLSRPDKA